MIWGVLYSHAHKMIPLVADVTLSFENQMTLVACMCNTGELVCASPCFFLFSLFAMEEMAAGSAAENIGGDDPACILGQRTALHINYDYYNLIITCRIMPTCRTCKC